VIGLGLAAVLAIGVVVAIVAQQSGRFTPRPLVTVHGVIGSEKQAFFGDPAVIAEFRRSGLDVQVDTAGSREIATTINLTRYDFAFPAGVPAAQKIKADHHAAATYAPFYTPMTIASFRPIAQMLAANGVARDEGGWYSFDMRAYLALVARNARWTDLQANTAYPASKSVLITSTDVRKSNSGAMYLSIASYVANGSNVVPDEATGQRLLPQVAPLFLRQGFTESSTDTPFEDYLAIGIGKSPMVMIYESQFLERAVARDRALTPEMVLMYPNPTVYSKHTLVPLKPGGDQVGRLLLSDPTLQQLEVKHGFHTNDTAAFTSYLKSRRVAEPPQLVNVVDPPAYDSLEAMITGIDQLYKGGGGA
jgi:hypothetical protein